jgi:hypothetical protein
MTTNPGFADQQGRRRKLRLIGFALVTAGLAIAIKGGYEFVQDAASAVIDDGRSGFAAILMLGGGGFLVVFGLGALNAGYLGAAARYTAGETMPVVKDSAAYLTDGQGILGAGRTVDDHQTGTGPFCTRCGVRNDEAARFCDGCGQAIA